MIFFLCYTYVLYKSTWNKHTMSRSHLPFLISHLLITGFRLNSVCVESMAKVVAWIQYSKIGLRSLVIYSLGLHVKCSLLLFDLNQNYNVSTNFRKTPKYTISWKYVDDSHVITYGQTNMALLIGVFLEF